MKATTFHPLQLFLTGQWSRQSGEIISGYGTLTNWVIEMSWMYTYQLMHDEGGRPVAAKLYHAGRNEPTDVVGTCRIAKGDKFTLANDCGKVKAGSEITIDNFFLYHVWFQDAEGNLGWADAEYSTSTDYATDMDDRRIYFTKYNFAIKQAAEIVHKPAWWHLFYSIDKRRPVIAPVDHCVGQLALPGGWHAIYYPEPGASFKLGYRFGKYPAGSELIFRGTEHEQLLLTGPDGHEFDHRYCHKLKARQKEDGYVHEGPMFEGKQIVLEDQVVDRGADDYLYSGGSRVWIFQP